ncbi:glycosyltransferase [Skermanella sp. TT6]|uniref:Glycosyltransferase n=1 Tax=Skermanella cutis TaxID=2775420 RepID=A0ABX7B0R3_9PROT|nr:glycosyltransferase [Skermanella sp. TT6]QQP87924.1 glycosyltransferase [Skermanella sp. TT6]
MQEVSFSQAQIKAFRRADVIFVAADGYTLAPSRIRAYSFAKACRERGLNAEVLSFFDHLGASGQGSGAYRMDEQEKLRLAALGADILKLNPTAILYMQKVSYHSLAVALAAGANGNPVVLDYDDFDFRSPFMPGMTRFMPSIGPVPATAEMARSSDLCVCASRRLVEIIGQFNERCELVPTGTDLSVFDVALRDAAGRGPGDPVELIWLGDIWGPQIVADVTMAVEAFAALPPSIRDLARLTIIGFGDFWPEFKATLAARLGDLPNLVFRERIAPAEAPGLLARCDIGLLPLADNPFNHCKSPTKMFEYMAMRVAVLGTPVGEAAHILRDGESGMLASDLPGYMRRMGTLILDGDLRRAMADRAYAAVLDGYHLGAMGDRLVGLLDGVREDRRRRESGHALTGA